MFCLSVYLSTYLFIYIYVYLSSYIYIYLAIHPSIYQSIFIFYVMIVKANFICLRRAALERFINRVAIHPGSDQLVTLKGQLS